MNMNISNDAPPTVDSDVNNQDATSTDTQKQDQPSPFSKVLAKKQTLPEDNQRNRGESDFNMLLSGIMGEPAPLNCSVETSKTESKHIVQLPPDLQNLVREIAVANGGREVHIEMNSNALKNLHIRIEKQEGAVAIQFQSSSEDTARLLSRNIDGLSQSLADRGVNVADIKVTTTQELNKKWSQKQGSKSDSQQGRSQSGRQGQR
jgi:flagellar hook-length control protein FliK